MAMARLVSGMRRIEEVLAEHLNKANRRDGLVCVVFANARRDFVKKEILPLVEYWHFRSGDHVSFFFVGYKRRPSDPLTDFSEQTFVHTIQEFERKAEWKYDGDTPLILCRGYVHSPTARLDFNSMLEFELEAAIRKKIVDSVETFFEAIIRTARETPGAEVHWKLSDSLGAHALGDALIDGLVSKLPGGVGRLVDAIRFFRIKRKVTRPGESISLIKDNPSSEDAKEARGD